MKNNIGQKEIFESIEKKPYCTETSIKILSMHLKNVRKNVINGYSVNLGTFGKIQILQNKRTKSIVNKNKLFKEGIIKEIINSKYYDVSFKIKLSSIFFTRNGYVFKKGQLFKKELMNKINNDIVYYRKENI